MNSEEINALPNVAPKLAEFRAAKAERDRVVADRRSGQKRIDAAEETFCRAAEEYRIAFGREVSRRAAEGYAERRTTGVHGPGRGGVMRTDDEIDALPHVAPLLAVLVSAKADRDRILAQRPISQKRSDDAEDMYRRAAEEYRAAFEQAYIDAHATDAADVPPIDSPGLDVGYDAALAVLADIFATATDESPPQEPPTPLDLAHAFADLMAEHMGAPPYSVHLAGASDMLRDIADALAELEGGAP